MVLNAFNPGLHPFINDGGEGGRGLKDDGYPGLHPWERARRRLNASFMRALFYSPECKQHGVKGLVNTFLQAQLSHYSWSVHFQPKTLEQKLPSPMRPSEQEGGFPSCNFKKALAGSNESLKRLL